MTQVVSAGDARPTRLRALYDRIEALPNAALSSMEDHVRLMETAFGVSRPKPGTSRVVAGATITERPDLVLEAGTEHPAEVAREGMVRR